jgi:hypothetical protein
MIQCECMCVRCDTQVFLLPDDQAPREIRRPSCGRRLPFRHIQPFGEAEWLACTDPLTLARYRTPRITNRKRRLFACACCRLLWDQLADPRNRAAVEVAERFADGRATQEELARAHLEACAVPRPARGDAYRLHLSAANAVLEAADTGPRPRLGSVVLPFGPTRGRRRSAEAPRLADLFREVVGNPFRSLNLDPAWLAWDDGCVQKLARRIYDERDFAALPVLADALEEAGGSDAHILRHCRGPGPHVLGCWVVDFLLGKG